MISNIYFLSLIISILCLLSIAVTKDRPVDRYYWSVMIFVPVIILGYWLKTKVTSPESAIIAFCFIYLDSTILMAIMFFSIMRSIRVKVPGFVKLIVYGLTIFHLITIWLSKDNNMYYETISIIDTGAGSATKMTSGPLKITHYIFLVTMFLAICSAICFGIFREGTYSKRPLFTYSIFSILAVSIYIYEMIRDVNFSILPVFYASGSIFLSAFYENFQSHNMHSLIGEKQSRTGLRSFAAFNKRKELLGYNTQFSKVFPDIEKVTIDTNISEKFQKLGDFINPLLDRGIEQGNYTDTIFYEEKYYKIEFSSFSLNNSRINGYLLELMDITESKKHNDIIEQFNDNLQKLVKENFKPNLKM